MVALTNQIHFHIILFLINYLGKIIIIIILKQRSFSNPD